MFAKFTAKSWDLSQVIWIGLTWFSEDTASAIKRQYDDSLNKLFDYEYNNDNDQISDDIRWYLYSIVSILEMQIQRSFINLFVERPPSKLTLL